MLILWTSLYASRVLFCHLPLTSTSLAEKGNVHLDYDRKVQLLALYKQEKLGPHTPEKDNETGYFDVVGADRR